MHKLEPYDFKVFNDRLESLYGRTENYPNYRLVWADDLLEKRWMTHTDEGLQLLHPEVREVPKYKNYIREKYVVERLSAVSKLVETDLVEELSYEPLWVFETGDGNPILPTWAAIKFLIENVIRAMDAPFDRVKYKDPESNPAEAEHLKLERVKAIEEALFGNESVVTDALRYKDGIVVPAQKGDSSNVDS